MKVGGRHMLITETSDQWKCKYITGLSQARAEKTNLAIAGSHHSGLKVKTIGDDIAWMKSARMAGVCHQSRSRFFCVAPGTPTIQTIMLCQRQQKLPSYTNVGLTTMVCMGEGIGVSSCPSDRLEGKDWTPESRSAAHPNARFTAPAKSSAHLLHRNGKTPMVCRFPQSLLADAAQAPSHWFMRAWTGIMVFSWAPSWVLKLLQQR